MTAAPSRWRLGGVTPCCGRAGGFYIPLRVCAKNVLVPAPTWFVVAEPHRTWDLLRRGWDRRGDGAIRGDRYPHALPCTLIALRDWNSLNLKGCLLVTDSWTLQEAADGGLNVLCAWPCFVFNDIHPSDIFLRTLHLSSLMLSEKLKWYTYILFSNFKPKDCIFLLHNIGVSSKHNKFRYSCISYFYHNIFLAFHLLTSLAASEWGRLN